MEQLKQEIEAIIAYLKTLEENGDNVVVDRANLRETIDLNEDGIVTIIWDKKAKVS